ncbi:MAG: YceI family protein [Bacteroidia bacterium]
MKVVRFFVIVLLISMGMGFSSGDNYVLDKNYTVTIHGTSNHDDWDETVGKVTGSGSVNANSDESIDLNSLHIIMEVNSITSKSPVMTSKTVTALKGDIYPDINFTLAYPLKSIKAVTGGSSIYAKGTLFIAGVTKSVILLVKVTIPKSGTLLVEGSLAVRMTDYGITPPTALFGMMTTGDMVTIHFKTNFVSL